MSKPTPLYKLESFMGDKYDTTIWTRGGTYHKVVVENSVEGGVIEERAFYARWRAQSFAKTTARGYYKAQAKKLKAKGHTPDFYRSGADDSYWNCSCECGWSSNVWTTKQAVVRDSHQSHLSLVTTL